MKTKILAFVLALVMVLSMALSVSATNTQSGELVLSVGNGKGTVTVDVYVQGGTGITNGTITVTFDASVLTVADVQPSSALAMHSVNQQSDAVTLSWVGSELTAEKTLLLSVQLEVAEGTDQDLTYTVSGSCYTDTEAVEVASDSVTVSFNVPVDTTELENAIAAGEAVDASAYTQESYAAVTAALNNAVAVLTDKDATQEAVNAAAKAIRDAIAALELKAADMTALAAAVKAAQDLDASKYTETSFTAVEKALTAAQAVLADTDATQAEVDAALKALQSAMDNLKHVNSSPDTGDTTQTLLWALVMLLSLAGFGVAMVAMIRSGRGKQVNRFLSLLLVTAMVLSMAPITGNAIVTGENSDDLTFLKNLQDVLNSETLVVQGEDNTFAGTVKQVMKQIFDLTLDQHMSTAANTYAPEDIVRVLVELDGDCLLDQGYTQGQISAFGAQVANDSAKLKTAQDYVARQIAELAPGKTTVKYNYTVALNGMAMSVPYGILSQIRALDNVKNAYICSEYQAPETTSSETVSNPNMYATSEGFGSATVWHELGYTGQGMTVAVLDTGLDVDHPSFIDSPANPRMTLADIEAVLTQLNAYTLFSETSAIPLEAEDLYYSEKVPYGFNYVDRGLDITHDYDQQGDHGSHVAGTVAANKIDSTSVVGVAPDAQIIVMKLFGQNGGAFNDDILAALEDCILLGVDVINMSLGSNAGFTNDSVLLNDVYGRVLASGIMLAISAGNSNSAATGNSLGTNLNYASDPDNGLVNSPGTYLGATCVASVENTHVMMNYFAVGDLKVPYVDSNYTFHKLEGTYEYVMIPGYGRTEDYVGLDLTGKIAVVSRGGGDDINFMVKQENAYNAGAVALIVYDNTDGNYISMYDGGFLPNVFISKVHGAGLAEAAVNGVGTLQILPESAQTGVPYWYAGELSDFSCWGVTSDLQLMPDVTAPGGSIYSCINDGQYGTMSGTSMASPHIAGMSALVLQYLWDVYPGLDDTTYHTIAESLVMCTATPLLDLNGILYSPRKQGAGSANVYHAVTSPVYLTSLQAATGETTPKASLGDDPQRTGTFSFSFNMHNLTGTAQAYTLDGSLLTDQVLEYEGKKYMSETGRDLSGSVTFEVLDTQLYTQYDMNRDGRTDMDDVQFMLDVCSGLMTSSMDMDVNGDGVFNTMDAQALYLMLLDGFEAQTMVTVPANATITVQVTIQLSAEDMAYMDANYENGIYVDGFVRAYAQNEDAVDLSLPFVGFYGDWHDAPVFDTGWYYEDSATVEYNRYMHVLFATLGGEDNYGGLGLNPYLSLEHDPYSPEHNVLSPNEDGYYDYVPNIYISLMRSAELLDFTWTDDATGEELFYEYYAYARKSYYWNAYGMCMPIVYRDGGLQPFTMYDEQGNLMVEDLQHLTLTIRAFLDDGDLDNVEVDENGNPIPDPAWADGVMTIPVVIDLQAPKMDLDTLRYYTEDGRNYVTFEIEDNYDVAAVVTTTMGGGVYDYIPVNTKLPGVDGEKATITIDITDYDASFEIVLCDYGCNETYYELTNVGNEGLAEDEFFAFRRYSTPTIDGSMYATDAYNGWYSFLDSDKMLMHTSQTQSLEPTVYAAEYVDGYIFGAQAGADGYNTLFVMSAGSWERTDLGDARAMYQTVYEWPGRTDYTYFPLKMVALDMAYDYTGNTMYILANAMEHETYFPEGEVNILLSMDLITGQITILGKIFAEEGEELLALTLACDNSGTLYTINYENGKLYTIDKTPAETTPQYGYGSYMAKCISTGDAKYYPAAYTQSMTVDHETDTLYWAGYQGYVGIAYFIELDKSTGDIVGMTETADNAEMVGLFKPWTSGNNEVPTGILKSISMNKDALYMNVGQNATLSVKAEPYNAKLMKVTYSSSDESVATVNEYGIVVATGIGSATITATCGVRTTTCLVSVSNVSGTLFGHSGDYWLVMDAGRPDQSNQIIDAMELDGNITASAYRDGYLYVSTLKTDYNADGDATYTTNLYKLNASTLQGDLLGSYSGKTTALAFNYADGFLYGLTYNETYDADWNTTISYHLIRVNMDTAETLFVATLDDIYPYSDLSGRYATCSGALAIDYEGNFYVNGKNGSTSTLARFNLDENDRVVNITTYAGFQAPHTGGNAMVWSQRNGGLLYVSGDNLYWVDVSDMTDVTVIALGTIRGASSTVLALAIPITAEPEVEGAVPTSITLKDSYDVPEGETIRIAPSLNPWNAVGSYVYTIADETIAKVNENGVVTGLTIGQTTLTVTETTSGLTTSTTIQVVKNPGYLYGYLQANLSAGIPLESWGKVPISNPGNYSFMHYGTYDLTIYAAAYYDGLVYAVGMHNLGGYYAFTVNPSNFGYNIACEVDVLVRALTFDYTTGTMYALASSETIAGGLYQMNLNTMEMTFLADNDLGAELVAMTCDAEGRLFASDVQGNLYAMDKQTAKLTHTGITSRGSMYLSSLTYDHNNDTIYWANGGNLYDVNVDAGTIISIGYTDCIISGMFSVPRHKLEVPETVEASGVAMQEKNTVAVGNSLAINAVVLPVSVATVDQTLVWTTSNAAIATVDANGVVTGVAPGVAYITATDVNGNSDTIMITVTENERFFYGYDEMSNSWIRFGMNGKVLETWADAKELSPIVAARYINGVLYAYDADGYFYTIDTETFQRTLMGNGIHGLTTSLEAWDRTHDEQIYYVDNVPYKMIDMTYSTVTDEFGVETTTMYGVMMAWSISDWRDSFSYKIAELDMQTGEITRLITEDEMVDGMSLRPTNLIYRNGSLYTINGYVTGLVTRVDLETGSLTGVSICPSYWGDFNGGRSLMEDPLTGEVYAIRDMRTDYIGTPGYTGDVASSVLYRISLGVAYVDEVATITGNVRLTGLFIK